MIFRNRKAPGAVHYQDAKFNADSSITYQQSHFKKGDTVQLFYESGNDKNFEFVKAENYNTLKSGKAASDFSKHKIIIDWTAFNDGKCYVSGKADWLSDVNNYIHIVIDVEGAIDNKEIIAPVKVIAVVKKPMTKKHR